MSDLNQPSELASSLAAFLPGVGGTYCGRQGRMIRYHLNFPDVGAAVAQLADEAVLSDWG